MLIKSSSGFADWVRSRRIASGITQEDLATKIRMSRRWVQQVETGKVVPTLAATIKLAAGLGMGFAGKLMRGMNDQVEFVYNESHLTGRATPLSVSMPTSNRFHGPRTVMPWLSNLLPDAEEVRTRWREKSRNVLTDLFAFYLLAAGVDAHAKNHSILLSGTSARLAPAYDLISAHGLWDPDRVKFKSSAAVKYGNARRYCNIDGRNLARAADAMGAGRCDQSNEFLLQTH